MDLWKTGLREEHPLLCKIIRDIISLRNARKASVAYFYFDFRDINKQARRNLLPSLLIQLSSHSEPRCDVLSRLFSEHEHGQHQPSDRAMTECLKEMLTLPADGPTYIIMDALDECPNASGIPSAREEVLELVNELVDLHLPKLHICITSRPEFDIKDALRPLRSHLVSLHDEHGQKQDIMNYVSSVVHSDKRMRRWLEGDKLLVIRVLSDKADGM